MHTLITGVAGSGKTTIAAELEQRNHTVCETDSVAGLCFWATIATGEPVPNFKRETIPDWAKQYGWFWNEKTLTALLNEKRTRYT